VGVGRGQEGKRVRDPLIRYGIASLLANVPCITCVICATAIVITRGPECSGWGWLLALALLLHGSLKTRKRGEDKGEAI
jgi:hypothetical protein